MPNRRLSSEELKVANDLLESIREQLRKKSAGDQDLHWALRRKVYKELSYDERGKPMQRRLLKERKRAEQKGLCPLCNKQLPEKYMVLDRLDAMGGYTPQNTNLICPACDAEAQASKGYA